MKTLAIYGFGGNGSVIADAAELFGWTNIRIYDERKIEFSRQKSWMYCGGFTELIEQSNLYDGYIIGLGDNKMRMAKIWESQSIEKPLVSIIHPSAVVSQYATIGPGCVAYACAVVNINAHLGIGCIISTGATVDHDCQLGDGVHISPGANLAGNVTVGSNSWVGIGAAVKQGITIGENAIVGAGAVVIRDVKPNTTVVGVPAREISRNTLP